MSFRKFAMVSLLALAIPMGASAGQDSLADPVVALMPHVKQLRASLNLSEAQASKIDSWIAEAPMKRKQMEGEMRALRAQMREAILNNESRLTRESIKGQIAEKEKRLIEMRALCVRMLRNTLNADQFARVVESYRTELKG